MRLPSPFTPRSHRSEQTREPPPYYREELDPTENRESTPPEDERLEWHGLYVVEAYGPSHVRGLLDGVEQLGWNDQGRGLSRAAPGEWIVENRGRSIGTAYWPINVLSRQAPTMASASGSLQAPLPQGVDHARGLIVTPTSGLTLVVLLFIFDDETASSVDATLRHEFNTFEEPIEGGWQIHSPTTQKFEAVASRRAELRACCAEFFDSHLPGAFARDLPHEHPSCEIVTASRRWPVESEREPSALHHYSQMVDLGGQSEAWKSESMPAFSLELPRGFSRSPALVLGGRRDEVFAETSRSNGDRGREGLGAYLFMRLDGFIALWASYQLVIAYHALLGSARDLGASPKTRSSQALARLSRVDDFLERAADARTLAEEIKTSLDRERVPWTRLLGGDFEAVDPARWRDSSLTRTLLESMRDEAESLCHAEARVRESYVVDSSLVGAAANIRLQRTLGWLTWALIAIGLVTIGIVAYQTWGSTG